MGKVEGKTHVPSLNETHGPGTELALWRLVEGNGHYPCPPKATH